MDALNEIDKILNALGYVGGDPLKKEQIAGYVKEAEEFMRGAGVPAEQLTTQTAYSVKSVWADRRDKGAEETLIRSDSFIVHLIARMRYKRV